MISEMILPDVSIREEIDNGNLVIKPFIGENLQPASLDLTLSSEIGVFENHNSAFVDVKEKSEIVKRVEVSEKEGFIIHPGEFILADTREYIEFPLNVIGLLTGRSSLGRLGIIVHATAGFFDPGFKGTATLEMHNIAPLPVRLYPGMRIAQFVFYRTEKPASRGYADWKGSKYAGQQGPTESKIHQDFE